MSTPTCNLDKCEACGRPIREGQPALRYADDVTVHKKCPTKPKASKPRG